MSNQPSWGRRQFLQTSACVAASLAAAPHAFGQSAAEEGQSAAAGQSADTADGSENWQLGCFTRPFSDFSFAQTLDGIAQAGYQAVGLMSIRLPGGSVALANASAEQAALVAQMAGERQLAVAATYYSGPPVQQSLQQGVAAMRKLLDNCETARCTTVVMGGTSNEQLYDDYYQAVADLCDYAAERSISLVLKPHGGLNATGPQCRRTIQRVGHPAFTLWYDPGNIYYYSDGQLDPVEDAATVDGLVTGMCVKDFEPPKNVAINPGSGKVDFPRVMQILQAGGFNSGPLIVETLAPGDLQTTIQNAQQARQRIQQWLQPA